MIKERKKAELRGCQRLQEFKTVGLLGFDAGLISYVDKTTLDGELA